MYVLTAHWPVEVELAKAVWRYYTRVIDLIRKKPYTPVAVAAKWARCQEGGSYTLAEGLRFATTAGTVQQLYTAWARTIVRGLRESTRLAHPFLQGIWIAFLEIGMRGGYATLMGRLTVPEGTTAAELHRQLPGAKWKLEEGGTLAMLNRPSWLLDT